MKLVDSLRAHSLQAIEFRNRTSAVTIISKVKEAALHASKNCFYQTDVNHVDLRFTEVQNLVRDALEAEGLKVTFNSKSASASSDDVDYYVRVNWK